MPTSPSLLVSDSFELFIPSFFFLLSLIVLPFFPTILRENSCKFARVTRSRISQDEEKVHAVVRTRMYVCMYVCVRVCVRVRIIK